MSSELDLAGVAIGDVLAGKFRIDKLLGVGGMGVVVAARHLLLDQPVALKFMRVEALQDRDAVRRFAREARAAAQIKSEHVARVLDVGSLENGAPYLVMEYLEGSDLAAWLQERGPLPWELVLQLLLQACEAVAEAHVLGIVHRDLKPANLFVTKRPDGSLVVKVLDFGISKLSTSVIATQTDHAMTRTTSLMGSPLYMSPEQMQTPKDVDARSDIWALGVIAYELIAGSPPFSGDTIPELVLKIVTSEPPPLRQLVPGLPEALANVVTKAMAKSRDARHRNIGELAIALREHAPATATPSIERILGIYSGATTDRAVQPAKQVSTSDAAPSQTVAPLQRTLAPRRERGRLFMTLSVASIALSGIILALVTQLPRRTQVPAAASHGPSSVVEPLKAESHHSSTAILSHPLEPMPSASASAASSTSTSPLRVTPQLRQRATTTGAATTANASARTLPSGPRKDCDPNFYFDAQGAKHFKPACFE